MKRATQLARRMVTHWGMSDRLGPVAYRTSEEHPFLGKEFHEQREFSEHTAQLIDEEVSKILHTAADRARTMLEENRDKLRHAWPKNCANARFWTKKRSKSSSALPPTGSAETGGQTQPHKTPVESVRADRTAGTS